jgi:transcriptional regulator with XRE-family HTH domain
MTELDAPNVGSRLRALRNERGLSLRALAELCGLSPNTISLIERSATSPSVSTLHRLATALGVSITYFFLDQSEEVRVLVTRSGERPRSGSSSVELESLGYGIEEQACDPFLVTLKPGASSGQRQMAHAGNELIYCLEGELDYEIAGEHYRLYPGDSLLFEAELPHRWSNPNRKPAVFLLIMQMTEQRTEALHQHLHP